MEVEVEVEVEAPSLRLLTRRVPSEDGRLEALERARWEPPWEPPWEALSGETTSCDARSGSMEGSGGCGEVSG